MILDIVFALVIILALFKGYSRGLILGLFSLLSVIIGLAAALKLSATVAGYLGKAVKVSEQWLPLISFIIVFIAVVLLIRLGAKAIERSVEFAMLGWLNKLGGIALFVIMYVLVFSVLLFYGEQMKLIPPEMIKQSVTYSFVQPLGPRVIDNLGSVIPVFKNMFGELQDFFGSLPGKLVI